MLALGHRRITPNGCPRQSECSWRRPLSHSSWRKRIADPAGALSLTATLSYVSTILRGRADDPSREDSISAGKRQVPSFGHVLASAFPITIRVGDRRRSGEARYASLGRTSRLSLCRFVGHLRRGDADRRIGPRPLLAIAPGRRVLLVVRR